MGKSQPPKPLWYGANRTSRPAAQHLPLEHTQIHKRKEGKTTKKAGRRRENPTASSQNKAKNKKKGNLCLEFPPVHASKARSRDLKSDVQPVTMEARREMGGTREGVGQAKEAVQYHDRT
jgi:hypothetical protein